MTIYNLTVKQAEILEHIKTFIETNRHSPTIREIAVLADISAPTCYVHLQHLKHKGAIGSSEGRPRTIIVLID